MVKRRLPLDLLVISILAALCALIYFRTPAQTPPATPPPFIDDNDAPVVDSNADNDLEAQRADASSLNQEGVDLARGGRFAEASAKLRAALQQSPSDTVIRANLQNSLTAWGFDELKQGHARAAADRFTDALAFGRKTEILSGLGIAQLKGQQYTEAIAALEEAVDKGAKDGATYVALGQAYEATDDRVHALEMLQRARDAGVHAGELQTHIDQLSREVDAEWDFSEESSRHFQIRFDAGEDRPAATQILHSLEAAYDDVGRKFGYFPDRPTPVVLYAEQDFHYLTQTPDWAGGVFDGRLKFPVRGLVAGAELDRVTRHEYAHSLIDALAHNRAPAWLNEGLAMWAEEQWPGDRRDWAEQVLSGQRLQPLAALQAPFANLPRDRVQPAYAQSYLTILFLIDQYDERRVPRLLESLRHSDSLQDAFADVYPLSLDGFEEAADRALG